jgi:hypothetical protein
MQYLDLAIGRFDFLWSQWLAQPLGKILALGLDQDASLWR